MFRHTLEPQEAGTSPHAIDNFPSRHVSLNGCHKLCKLLQSQQSLLLLQHLGCLAISGGVGLSLHRCLGWSLCICCIRCQVPPLLPEKGGLTTQFYRGDWSPRYISPWYECFIVLGLEGWLMIYRRHAVAFGSFNIWLDNSQPLMYKLIQQIIPPRCLSTSSANQPRDNVRNMNIRFLSICSFNTS